MKRLITFIKKQSEEGKTIYNTSIIGSAPFLELERATLCGAKLCVMSKCAAGRLIETITEKIELNKNKVKNFFIW